jgi:hypothetical protein
MQSVRKITLYPITLGLRRRRPGNSQGAKFGVGEKVFFATMASQPFGNITLARIHDAARRTFVPDDVNSARLHRQLYIMQRAPMTIAAAFPPIQLDHCIPQTMGR